MEEMQSISDLENWMYENCYGESYAIGSRNIYEGFGLKKENENYIWYFTERGQDNDLKKFTSEKEAVDYAYHQIKSDKYASRHLLAMVKEKREAENIQSALTARKIAFETDTIPYGGLQDMRVRIFVFGCDIKRASDLKKT